MSKREMNDYGTIWEKKGAKTGFTSRAAYDEAQKPNMWLFFIVVLLIIGAGAVYLSMMFTATGLFVGCGPDEFIIVQSISGDMTVIDEVGVHFKGLSTYWIYPRKITLTYGSVRATFNDGKLRGIDTLSYVQLPTEDEKRKKLHIQMSADYKNIERLTESVIVNAVKNTAPIMSTKELQGHRKHEFCKTVNNQMIDGLYRMQSIKTEDGRYATEIVMENDKPIVTLPSPFDKYGLTLTQFSITNIQIPDEEYKAIRMERIAEIAEKRYEAAEKALKE